MKKINCIFFGTPGLSANILKYLYAQIDLINIIAVVTNPDKPAGRGHELMRSAVGQFALDHNLPLLQPEKVRNNPAFIEEIKNLSPDICIVVAYGKILPQELLDIPPMGFLNVHTSLLPKYRGAAPIQHALLNGEKVTGLTVQQMSLGMDEGDILLQESWDITPSDTTGGLFERTAERGGPLLVETLKGLQDGTIQPKAQNHEEVSYTTMIEKKDGELQPGWTGEKTYHAWQAYTPWPGLFYTFRDIRVTLLEINIVSSENTHIGNWIIQDNLPAIIVDGAIVIIKKIHPAGKKPMSGEEFVRGFMRD